MSSALDRLKEKYPDGVPTTITGDELARKIEEAGKRLDLQVLEEDLEELEVAIATQERIRAALAIAKMVARLGLSLA